jgi:hypothetical protein
MEWPVFAAKLVFDEGLTSYLRVAVNQRCIFIQFRPRERVDDTESAAKTVLYLQNG